MRIEKISEELQIYLNREEIDRFSRGDILEGDSVRIVQETDICEEISIARTLHESKCQEPPTQVILPLDKF